jgi:hypothetical protein
MHNKSKLLYNSYILYFIIYSKKRFSNILYEYHINCKFKIKIVFQYFGQFFKYRK